VRILLVNPLQSMSLVTFSEVADITGRSAYMPNLALPTVAALTPDDIEVVAVDENVEAIPYQQDWDLVGITGYITQRWRMFDIADEFRRRGKIVAIGGPYASLSPQTVRPHADILFIGEAEHTWPQFLADFRTGHWKSEYRNMEPVDIGHSPLPDVRYLRNDAYFMGVVQTSRGCPFECEFCDVIVYLGRKQRHKTPERVVQELQQLYEAGYRTVFLSDDNFTANRPRAEAIVRAIIDWNSALPEPVTFATQISIDVAREQDTALLDLCALAGLKLAFIGIETPDPTALREVKKHQNVRRDLLADIHKIQRRGIMVQAGMICGFDSDTTNCFLSQYKFIQEAGVPMVSLSLLNAPEGTPLEARLIREGRLKAEPQLDLYLTTNLVPKRMTEEQLIYGAKWLLNRIYSPRRFLERLKMLAEFLPETHTGRLGTRAGTELWQRLVEAFERLSPEFRDVPREAVKYFRRKDLEILVASLVFYKHVICVLRSWGAWDEELAELEEPDFKQMAFFATR
jgi:radical SAM superfamily enzyme YgiQ (UPF0313 family)